MAANSLYGELSLWDQPVFPEGSAFTSGSLNKHHRDDGGPASEDESFWETAKGDNVGQVLLASSLLQHGIFDEECSLTNWLEDRIDVAAIDEMVNSPEFDAIFSENVDDSSEMLSSIDLHPLQPVGEDAPEFADDAPEEAFLDSLVQDLGDESTYIENDSESVPHLNQQDSPSAFSPFSSSHYNDSDSSSSTTSLSSTNSCSIDLPKANQRSFKKRKGNSAEKKQASDPFPLKDRKIKKRCQNKTAASRYRSKKKMEFGVLSETESSLLEKNKELAKNASQLETEIGYLKGLMKEILYAKGLLKKSK